MAIDPRISLAVRAPDIGSALNNALLNAQRIQQMGQARDLAPLQNQLLQQQVASGGRQATQEIGDAQLLGTATFAQRILPDLQSGDIPRVEAAFAAEQQRVLADNDPNNDIVEGFQMFQEAKASGDFSQLIGAGNNAVQMAVQRKLLQPVGGSGGLASAKTEFFADGSSIQGLPSGETVAKDPQGRVVTGQAREDMFAQSAQFGLDVQQKEADIAVNKAEKIAIANKRAERSSKITQEMSTRNRDSKRGAINLAQAATLVEKAVQGVAGSSKVRLAKLFPGIDVGSEAALSQSLTNLALDELQKFKGPTTDFEFQKTEQIAGTLGDSQSANRAKIASLQRANWFNQREAKQFRDHVKSGGDPDTFGFNFGEPISTKKGVFTLQDLQDTAVDANISIDEVLKRLNK